MRSVFALLMMNNSEFVIVLTEHLHFGTVFQPFLIHRQDKFYITERIIKPYESNSIGYKLNAYESELVKQIEKYSDQRLMRRFSRAKTLNDFYATLEPEFFRKHIAPFIGQCMYEVARILMVSPVRLMFKNVKYANIHDEDEIAVSPLFPRPVFNFERTETDTRYRLKIFSDEKEIPLLGRGARIVAEKPCAFIVDKKMFVFESLDAKKLTPFFNKEYISVPRNLEEKYYSGFIKNTIRDFDVEARGFQVKRGETTKVAVLSLEKNLKYEPCFVLTYRYDNESFLAGSGRQSVVKFQKKDESFLFLKISRDKEWESAVLEALMLNGLRDKEGFLSIKNSELLEDDDAFYLYVDWLNENRAELQKKGLVTEQRKLDKSYFIGERKIEIKTGLTDDWFDIYATVVFGNFRIPFYKLKNFILNDIREFELPDGEIAIIPEEWFARYKALLPFARVKNEKMQFGKHHFALFKEILEPENATFIKRIEALSGSGGKILLPDGLNARMRNYQKAGFRWMQGLHTNGFGGCLADDMGLGKTLQTLALLLKNRRRENTVIQGDMANDGQLTLFGSAETQIERQLASLIVLPTSLVHNWEAEIQKFTPSLSIYKHVGQQRKSDEQLAAAVSAFDVILTTYGTVRNDAEKLSKFRFFYLILDESQYIKNPGSKTYRAIMKLKGEHRLTLTGTPIENSLSDLWAQLNFLNKGMLGNLTFFRRFFINPIEKESDVRQQEKLMTLIRPFVLRRTKEEVAKDLPPLMEQVIICEMEEKQQRAYDLEKSAIRNSILEGIDHGGIKNSAMIILRGFTRLRQLANHPGMVEDIEVEESGKFEEIFRMLENVVAEKHKVLIFSSFVRHLELIRERIENESLKYSMLTGKTINRSEVISRFQGDAENHIFLISMKAGGVGLNLTGADYVFIVDPWWNPAVENQAISRAHRIGQDKPVFVYRFITQGSIEEKIQQLQQRKSSLADKFINSNNPLQEISREEILNLFE